MPAVYPSALCAASSSSDTSSNELLVGMKVKGCNFICAMHQSFNKKRVDGCLCAVQAKSPRSRAGRTADLVVVVKVGC